MIAARIDAGEIFGRTDLPHPGHSEAGLGECADQPRERRHNAEPFVQILGYDGERPVYGAQPRSEVEGGVRLQADEDAARLENTPDIAEQHLDVGALSWIERHEIEQQRI